MVLTEGHFVENLEAALDSLDQPTFDGLNAYFMSHAIRSAGFTVALSGTGGDELFGGYTTYRDLPVLQRWSPARRVDSARPAGRRGRSWRPGRCAAPAGPCRRRPAGPSSPTWSVTATICWRSTSWPTRCSFPDFSANSWRPTLPSALADGLPPAMRQRLVGETGGRTPLSAISVMEQRLFLGERLLRDNDVASMACSLEQRVPLVDQVLFESVDRLPDQARYQPLGRKAMLRRIGLRGLDPALFERPKSGFVLPFDRWIRRGLKEGHGRDPARSAGGRAVGLRPAAVERLWQSFLDGAPGMYWSRVWSVYVFVRWCHRNRVFR